MADPGHRPVGPGTPPPPLFFAKLRPEGPKKVFGTPPPPPVPLSKGLDDRGPRLISSSGSGTADRPFTNVLI